MGQWEVVGARTRRTSLAHCPVFRGAGSSGEGRQWAAWSALRELLAGGVSEEGGGGQAGHEEHDAGVKWIGRRIYFYTKYTYRYKCF